MKKVPLIAGLTFSVIGMLSVVFGSIAQETAPSSSPSATQDKTGYEVPRLLLQKLIVNPRNKEQYISRLFSPVRNRGHEGIYIDQSSIDKFNNIAIRKIRAKILSDLISRDKNGDGTISESEIIASLPEKIKKALFDEIDLDVEYRIASEIQKRLGADLDGDRQISLEEASSYSSVKARLLIRDKYNELNELLLLDPDTDGKLTVQELEKLGVQAFEFFDINKTGILENDEVRIVRKALKKVQGNPGKPHLKDRDVLICNPPTPGEHDEIVLVGVREGNGLSSISVVGVGRTTTTGILYIEPGETPLYIIAKANDSFIWQLQGATDRVTNLVLAPPSSAGSNIPGYHGMGATGIDESKVSYLPIDACVSFLMREGSGSARWSKRVLETIFGRPLTGVIAAERISAFSVPSGSKTVEMREGRPVLIVKNKSYPLSVPTIDILSGRSGADPVTIAEFQRSRPDGIIDIDETSIISSRTVDKYSIYPEEAGLIQLMNKGKLKRLKWGAYYIQATFDRFPAGLDQRDIPLFMLQDGIALPDGKPKYSCVIPENPARPREPYNFNCSG